MHFEKSVEGVQAAIHAVITETGDSLVSLECEASKNLLKYHPLLDLPNKEKESSKPKTANPKWGNQRMMRRSLSFNDIPAKRNGTHPNSCDVEIPSRAPPGAIPPAPERDNNNPTYSRGNYTDVQVNRKGMRGPQFPMALQGVGGSPHLGEDSMMSPVHPQYMKNNSDDDKDCYVMCDTDPRYWYYLPPNQVDMQASQSRQAYYPVQNHHQNPYYDARYQHHNSASALISSELSELERVRRSPPVFVPVSPRGPEPQVNKYDTKYVYIYVLYISFLGI